MSRYYYRKDIPAFLKEPTPSILGELVKKHEFALEEQQRNAWITQIELIKTYLSHATGEIIFEYTIPRMGKRIDCVIIAGAAILAIEFKIGAQYYDSHAINQAMDYALDLKNFHDQSHHQPIIPVLICTEAVDHTAPFAFYPDGIAKVILSNGTSLTHLILNAQSISHTQPIAVDSWINSIYKPTPSIIEAAQALYEGHSVEEISRSDAGAINLSKTAKAITEIINHSKLEGVKSICFLTGVPGAGKTLAGLNLANSWYNPDENKHAVFLSGNGPLVEVLREALARNEIENAHIDGKKKKKMRPCLRPKPLFRISIIFAMTL